MGWIARGEVGAGEILEEVEMNAGEPAPGISGIVAASGFLVGCSNGEVGDQPKNEECEVVSGIVESRDARSEKQSLGSSTTAMPIAIGAEDALADDDQFAPV